MSFTFQQNCESQSQRHRKCRTKQNESSSAITPTQPLGRAFTSLTGWNFAPLAGPAVALGTFVEPMRLSEFLADVGQPFPYYPSVARIIGMRESVFLLRLVWWTGLEKSGDGWIYKTQAELEQETGMSRREQETARANLRALGLLHERNERLNHRMFYRVDMEKLNEIWEANNIPERRNVTLGNERNGHSTEGAFVHSSNTTEETQNRLAKVAALPTPASDALKETKRFKAPSLEEVKLQCSKIGLAESEAERFLNYHASRGWVVGKAPMKNWHFALNTWKMNAAKFKAESSSMPSRFAAKPTRADGEFCANWRNKDASEMTPKELTAYSIQ